MKTYRGFIATCTFCACYVSIIFENGVLAMLSLRADVTGVAHVTVLIG